MSGNVSRRKGEVVGAVLAVIVVYGRLGLVEIEDAASGDSEPVILATKVCPHGPIVPQNAHLEFIVRLCI